MDKIYSYHMQSRKDLTPCQSLLGEKIEVGNRKNENSCCSWLLLTIVMNYKNVIDVIRILGSRIHNHSIFFVC